MEQVRGLGLYRKILLAVMAVMLAVFAVIYARVIGQTGFEYKNAILQPASSGDETVYSGRIYGKQASFVVTAEKTVTFQWGEQIYGPYAVTEDPSAIPEERRESDSIGVEIRNGDQLMFRGGIEEGVDGYWFYREDGTLAGVDFQYVTDDGVIRDENGDEIDLVSPTAEIIWELVNDPQMTHKGQWDIWFLGLFISFINAGAMIFADELYYLRIMPWVRDAENAEPTDFQLGLWRISWAVICVVVLAVLIWGLQ